MTISFYPISYICKYAKTSIYNHKLSSKIISSTNSVDETNSTCPTQAFEERLKREK